MHYVNRIGGEGVDNEEGVRVEVGACGQGAGRGRGFPGTAAPKGIGAWRAAGAERRESRAQSLRTKESARRRQTRQTASRTIRFDILLSPRLRSTNMMGISPMRKPRFQARKLISIWKA